VSLETLQLRQDGGVLFADIAAPPMNLLGPDLAERYGWINRALPAAELSGFVAALAQRISGFPAGGHAVVKQRVNAIALAPVEDFRRDSDLFAEGVREPAAQQRIGAAMQRGLQTRDAELELARMLGS
jgi:uncharacterized protein (DUF1501 family)